VLWLVLPYLAIASFVLGHVWRWRHDQFGWRTFNPPLVGNRLLRLGSPLIHVGVAAVIGGHLLGLLVPENWTAALGVTGGAYRVISVTAGTLAGATLLAGLGLLVARRIVHPAVRRATTAMDAVMYLVLAAVVLLGIWGTVGVNVLRSGHDYRETVAVWFRGVFLFRPDPSLMAGAPLVFRLHTFAALALVGVWPFTRLVHAWAVPIAVLRPPTGTTRGDLRPYSDAGRPGGLPT